MHRVSVIAALLPLTAACIPPFPKSPDELTADCQSYCAAEGLPLPGAPCQQSCASNIIGAVWDNPPPGTVSVPLGVQTIYGGTHCELQILCPDASACESAYLDCMERLGYPELCQEEYQQCDLDLICGPQQDECYAEADQAYQDCVDAGGGNDCDQPLVEARQRCECLYDICMGYGIDDCEGTLSLLVAPPPTQTAATRWQVSRRFLDQEAARLARLDATTFNYAVAAADRSSWRGVHLGDVDPRETLHRLGLRSGDLVRRVNGQRVTDLAQSWAAVQALRSASELVLELERNGAPRTHRYTLVP